MSEKSENLEYGVEISQDFQRRISTAKTPRNVTTCAIKRTVKTAGIWILGTAIASIVILAIFGILNAICDIILSAFPIIGIIFKFVVVTACITVILLIPIYGTYDTYNRHVRDCEDENRMKERGK